MIKRSVLSVDPFVFRITSADAGDTARLTSDGIDVKFTKVNGEWVAPTDGKVFHPAENMIALPTCTQLFIGKDHESASVTIDGEEVVKNGGDGGYYYMNSRSMPAKFNNAGTVLTFWHVDKIELTNRTIHNVDANDSITIQPAVNKQKYIVVGSGNGMINEVEVQSITVVAVNDAITYTASNDTTMMEIEV